MAISEELQRRIENLVGETKGSISNREMELFLNSSPTNAMELIGNTKGAISDREMELFANSSPTNAMELIGNTKGAISDREMELFANSSPSNFITLTNGSDTKTFRDNDPNINSLINQGYYEFKTPSVMNTINDTKGSMSDQEMNMMMANQGARQGISPVEQRAVAFTSYLNTTDRTAPEEVVNNYAMGNMSFDDAIQLSQPIQVIDEVVVTGQMPDMAQEQRQAMAAGMLRPLGGGRISEAEYKTYMEAMNPSSGTADAKMMELRQAIEVLQQQMGMTSDPEEKELLGRMIENTTIKALAPQSDLVDQLSQGAGEDDMMAHVRSGDINVSREMLENNPALEDAIEGAALEVGIDPESMVYGTGIASLNEVTGAEQHGFLKKIAKGVKKVVKVIAPVAAVVPGPWQAPAIAYNRAKAVVNIAKGEGGVGDLLTASGGFGGDSKIGKFFSGTQGINPTASAATTASGGISDLLGRAKEFILPGNDKKGLFKNIAGGIGNLLGGGQPEQGEEGSFFGRKTPQFIKGIGDAVGLGGASGLRDVYGGEPMRDANGNIITNPDGSPVLSGFMKNAQGGLSGMGMLGIGALATGLGKLAYEDTKKDKGVQLTPLNTMNAAGRYNLEAEIARRMGQQAPNPTEFGLLPANTLPQLSGGQPRLEEQVMAAAQGGEVQYPNKGLESLARVAPDVVKRMGYNMGGYVMPMAYAEGGNVAVEDFERMNGQINGEGTETSDDVPAMLSDGEFVMTGQAVRGAGSYNMNNESGIITLSPTGAPSRDGGTDLMYQLMEAFSSQARPA